MTPTAVGKSLILARTVTLLLTLVILKTDATRTCHQCNGINCLRTSYAQEQKCQDALDVCATVFKGQTVQAQGCLQELSEDLRTKCTTMNQDNFAAYDAAECYLCNADGCNNLGALDYKCIQCDSKTNENCGKNPALLVATRCPLSRAINSYCYVLEDGEHIVRGCSLIPSEQKDCHARQNCMLCSPYEIDGCNRATMTSNNSTGGGSGGTDGGSGTGGGSGGTDGGSGTGGGSDGSGGDGGSGNDNGGTQSIASHTYTSLITILLYTLILFLK